MLLHLPVPKFHILIAFLNHLFLAVIDINNSDYYLRYVVHLGVFMELCTEAKKVLS